MPLPGPIHIPPIGPQTDPTQARVAAIIGGQMASAPARGFGLTPQELGNLQAITAGYSTTAETRSRIVNGAMQHSQENGNAGGTVSGYYPADQWSIAFATTGALTCARLGPYDSVASGDSEITSFVRTNVTTADTSLAAGEAVRLIQIIEGNRIHDFKWGASYAKPAVLRFRARTGLAGGTFAVNLKENSGTATFVKHCTFTAPVAVWQDFTIPIPPCTIGTWATGTNASLNVQFLIATGAPGGGVDGGWTASNVVTAGPISNWLSAINQYFDVTSVGLYLDPQNTGVAPAFQMPDEAEELRACQRYWQQLTALYYITYASAGGQNLYSPLTLPVVMRIAPAITVPTAGTLVNTSSVVNDLATTGAFRFGASSTAAGVTGVQGRTLAFSSRM